MSNWAHEGDQLLVSLCELAAAGVVAYQNGEPIRAENTDFGNIGEGSAWVKLYGSNLAIEDQYKSVSLGLVRCQRTWRNTSDSPVAFNPTFEVERSGLPDFWMIPAVSYNGNQVGTGKEPKGWHSNGEPWVFAYDRCAIPSCSIAEVDGVALGLFVDSSDCQSLVSSVSVRTENGRFIQQIRWPAVEAPLVYTNRTTYTPANIPNITLKPGESFQATVYVSAHATAESAGLFYVLDDAWNVLGSIPTPWYDVTKARDLSEEYASNYLWLSTPEFVAFRTGYRYVDGAWRDLGHRFELGWAGQNSGLALGLLLAYQRTGNQKYWDKGAAVLDFWAEKGQLSKGLMRTHFNRNINDPTNRLDTCNLGHGARRFLEAYTLSCELGRVKPGWKEAGLGVCDFFVENQLHDNRFGKLWSPEGELLDETGTTGAYILLALPMAYRITGDKKYLDAAVRGFRAYVETDLRHMQCYGAALDTNCIDKESAWPLLVAGLDLYEITGDSCYLQEAERAGYYLSTWLFHYNIPFAPGTLMHSIGYCTLGATAVSVQHHHLDPWGAMISADWVRLGKYTQKERWRQIGLAAWNQATIGLWDGQCDPDGLGRYPGSQDEAWFQANWEFRPEGKVKGQTSTWLVAWPTAFRMLAAPIINLAQEEQAN